MYQYVAACAIALVACGGAAVVTDAGPNGVPADAVALPPTPYLDPLVPLERVAGPAFVETLEVRARDDGMLFYCSGVRGLNVVDATDPTASVHLYSLAGSMSDLINPRCQHLAWSGDRILATSKGDEFQPTPFLAAFDLTRSPPSEMFTLTVEGTSFGGIAAAGEFVYVTTFVDGIMVFQWVGESLVKHGSLDLENSLGIAAVGTMLYVADGLGGLAIVDAVDPASPRLVGQVDLGGPAQSVEVDTATNTAWVAAGAAGLVSVDISNPAAPQVVGVYDSPGSATQVALAGDYAYLADWNDARVVDIADRSAPTLIATERPDVGGAFPRVLGVAARNEFLFAGEWTGTYALELHPERRASDLWFGDRTVEFGQLEPGDADAAAVIVQNQGSEPLSIASIRALDTDVFSVDPSEMTLDPGEAGVIEVTFRPSGTDELEGTLELLSDDPDEGRRTIPLSGNNRGAGVGDQAPPVIAQLLSGGTWSLPDQRGEVVVMSYFATF